MSDEWLSPEERVKGHVRVTASFLAGKSTKAEFDAASHVYHREPENAAQHVGQQRASWLLRLLRRVAWGRWE
jgi:hypothetical protein